MQVELKNGKKGSVFDQVDGVLPVDQDGLIKVYLDDNSLYFATPDEIVGHSVEVVLDVHGFEWRFNHRRTTIMNASWYKKAKVSIMKNFIKEHGIECVTPCDKRTLLTKRYLSYLLYKVSETSLFLTQNP
jgi:hypothetical protein